MKARLTLFLALLLLCAGAASAQSEEPFANSTNQGTPDGIPGNFGFCGFAFGSGGALQITLEEAESCNALVRQKAADAGLTCVPF